MVIRKSGADPLIFAMLKAGSFFTMLILVIWFLILTDLMKVLFEFCVIEVFKFYVIL